MPASVADTWSCGAVVAPEEAQAELCADTMAGSRRRGMKANGRRSCLTLGAGRELVPAGGFSSVPKERKSLR